MYKALAVVLILTLSGVPAIAGERPPAGPIAAAAAREIARQAREAPRGENPYMLPGLGLIGGGGTLMVLGMVYASGVECSETAYSFNCGTTHNKGLIATGAIVAGIGAFLIFKGESRRDSLEIAPKAGGFAVRHRIRF